MYLIIIFIKISFITCFNITETTNNIKDILVKYKNKRFSRCTNKLEGFVGKTLNFLDRTERYNDFLKYLNVSECSVRNDLAYVRRHILNGLIINEDLPESHWHEYKTIHKKVYHTPHYEMAALSKWRDNVIRVAQHNRDYLAGKLSYSLHLNHFADMHPSEYFRKILKLVKTVPLYDPTEDRRKSAYRRSLKCKAPKKVDWRSKGFRPRREEQWHCGACYAFAVTHAMQAQLYKIHGNVGELSPQQIVDCSFKDGNMGCDGGSLRGALRYAAREGLIMEKQYPYVGKRGSCKYRRDLVRVRPKRWATIPSGDERAMERVLAAVGPLAVGINASPYTFQLNGIYDDPLCTPWQLNHAMLLVGYTPEYWILLNWWGKKWGEDGYM
ncbi:hypothetical protein O3G_MSEX005414, partial [Manduca sexta]